MLWNCCCLLVKLHCAPRIPILQYHWFWMLHSASASSKYRGSNSFPEPFRRSTSASEATCSSFSPFTNSSHTCTSGPGRNTSHFLPECRRLLHSSSSFCSLCLLLQKGWFLSISWTSSSSGGSQPLCYLPVLPLHLLSFQATSLWSSSFFFQQVVVEELLVVVDEFEQL